jgi:alanyl-tRNA synthetase
VSFLLATKDESAVVLMTTGMKGAKFKAGDWAKHTILACGGKGGGSPESGQGSSSKPELLPEALEKAKEWAIEKTK